MKKINIKGKNLSKFYQYPKYILSKLIDIVGLPFVITYDIINFFFILTIGLVMQSNTTQSAMENKVMKCKNCVKQGTVGCPLWGIWPRPWAENQVKVQGCCTFWIN